MYTYSQVIRKKWDICDTCQTINKPPLNTLIMHLNDVGKYPCIWPTLLKVSRRHESRRPKGTQTIHGLVIVRSNTELHVDREAGWQSGINYSVTRKIFDVAFAWNIRTRTLAWRKTNERGIVKQSVRLIRWNRVVVRPKVLFGKVGGPSVLIRAARSAARIFW